MKPGGSIADDRGRRVPLHATPFGQAEARDASHLSAFPPPRSGVLLQVLASGWLITIVLGFHLGPDVAAAVGCPVWLGFLLASIGVFAAMFAGAAVVKRARRARRRASHDLAIHHHVRTALARDGRCPACAYPVSGLAPEPGGHTVCAECGAAWRLDLWSADAGIYGLPATGAGGLSSKLLMAPDGRGVLVPLVANTPQSWRNERIRAYAEQAPERVRRRRAFGIAGWAAGTAACALAILPLQPGDPIDVLVGVVLTGVAATLLLFAAMLAVRHSVFRLAGSLAILDLVSAGDCPCCETRLRSEPSPIDGRLLCDCCGSAWEACAHKP